MKLYNTMTQQKEELVTIEPGKVRMYVCGPTVYNYIHIGNARPVVVFDTVRRFLEYKGYEVTFVQNYTDVDDKIIAEAIKEGVDSSVISKRYIQAFIEDTKELGSKPATVNPKATEEIPGMVAMIQELIDKGHAYEKNGTVYYRTRSFSGYGKLSKKNIDDLESGARIAVNEEKEDPLDFVLWKPKKEGEPAWESPWSEGRPGWHIECSVMSRKYLGDQIDIHAGGVDLIFPHHENEIAQSEACTGKEFARYWMHNAHVNIDNKKMSKSEGNFFTVREIKEKYPLQVIRFFLLSVHYRSPINFSRDIVEAAKNGLERIQNAANQLKYLLQVKKERGDDMEEKKAEEAEILTRMDELNARFDEVMEDDFNTADAITVLFDTARLANTVLSADSGAFTIQKVLDKLKLFGDILGIAVEDTKELPDAEVEQLILDRTAARKAKDFARADEIRKELLDRGIILEDTREGVKWKRS